MKRLVTVMLAMLCALATMLGDGFSISAETITETTVFFPGDIQGTTLLSYNGTTEIVSIPEGVTVISENCFANHSEIESVVFPDSLQSIGQAAFMGCSSLKQLMIPDSVMEIGFAAFANCASLQSVTLSEQIEVLEFATFQNCISLKQICVHGDALQSIQMYCFSGCTALEEAIFPDSLREVGTNAFSDCSILHSINLGESIETINSCAFQNCEKLEQVLFPNTIQSISSDAFSGCDLLLTNFDDTGMFIQNEVLLRIMTSNYECKIPDGVVNIMTGAFSNQKQLISVSFPQSVRYIKTEAFQNCSNIMELKLNNGLLSIGENALSGMQSLDTLIIPASVAEIGRQENCTLNVIYGTPGTAAEEFALENGIAFHDAAELQLSDKPVSINYGTDTWSIQNAGADFNGEYYLTEAARDRLGEIMTVSQDKMDAAWDGECFGLSISLILLKAGEFTPEQIQPGAKTVSEITSDQAVQSFLNYYHFTQHTADMKSLATAPKTESQTMYRIIQMGKASKHGGLPFLISFSFTESGHAVVGYGQEDGSWEIGGEIYDGRILIWDPNFPTAPNENAYLYYDSRTLAHCVPCYNADSKSASFIKRVTNAVDILNAYPYPFDTRSGDVNRDGEVRISDAVMLAHIIAEDAGAGITTAGLYSADCNNDGLIQLVDMRVLLKQLI